MIARECESVREREVEEEEEKRKREEEEQGKGKKGEASVEMLVKLSYYRGIKYLLGVVLYRYGQGCDWLRGNWFNYCVSPNGTRPCLIGTCIYGGRRRKTRIIRRIRR